MIKLSYTFMFMMLVTFGGSAAVAQPKPITIYLAGDSTMAKKLPEKRPETGWGEMLPQYFQDSTVTIDNRAHNGRSTRTFISEGRWQANENALHRGENPNYPNGIEDNTHFNPFGAEVMAGLVADGIRQQRLAIAKSLKPRKSFQEVAR